MIALSHYRSKTIYTSKVLNPKGFKFNPNSMKQLGMNLAKCGQDMEAEHYKC